jgi:hypothetical protein
MGKESEKRSLFSPFPRRCFFMPFLFLALLPLHPSSHRTLALDWRGGLFPCCRGPPSRRGEPRVPVRQPWPAAGACARDAEENEKARAWAARGVAVSFPFASVPRVVLLRPAAPSWKPWRIHCMPAPAVGAHAESGLKAGGEGSANFCSLLQSEGGRSREESQHSSRPS